MWRLSAHAIATAVLAACCLSSNSVVAQENDEPPATQLRQVERAIEAGRNRTEELDREAARIEDELRQLQRTLVESARRAQGQEETVTELAASNPQRRLLDPPEVAAAVLWLALPSSSSITGQSIAVAGGEVM